MENIHPTPAQLSENRGVPLHRLAIAMSILPTISIILRFWSRLVASRTMRLWWDDWLALVSWCLCICCTGFTLRGTQLGLGHHFYAFKSRAGVTELLRLFYVAQLAFDCGITTTKFSVLLFYKRVFPVSTRRYKVLYWFTCGLAAIFILIKLPAQILSCVPPRKVWMPEIDGKCQNGFTNNALLLIGLLLDVITDLMILLLPMPVISGLQINRNRKFALFVVFFCGYATWVTSIGRLAAYLSIQRYLGSPDISYYQVPTLGWSLAEMGIGVSSICVPAWFYLFRRASKGGMLSLFSSRDVSEFEQRRLNSGSDMDSKLTSRFRGGLSRFRSQHHASQPTTTSSSWNGWSETQSSMTHMAIPEGAIVKDRSFDVSFQSFDASSSDEGRELNHVAPWNRSTHDSSKV